MSLKLNSSGGGSVTLQEPTTSSARTLSLPDNTGTVVSTGSTSVVTPAMLTQPLTLATAQNTTSGTSIDFTGIPSWVRRITVNFNGVSISGTAITQIQLGTSAGVVTSGYVGICMGAQGSSVGLGSIVTSGFPLNNDGNAAYTFYGQYVFALVSGNIWSGSGTLAVTNSTTPRLHCSGGSVTLGGTLDRLRLTTSNGTDTFDAGSVNIMYEG